MKPLSGNDPQKPSAAPGWFGSLGGAQKYLGIGIQAGASVAFYLGIGLLLDHWLNTFPWLTLIGILVGIAGMAALFIRMNKELDARSRAAQKKKSDPSGRSDTVN